MGEFKECVNKDCDRHCEAYTDNCFKGRPYMLECKDYLTAQKDAVATSPSAMAGSAPLPIPECSSCGEEMPMNECPKSERPCGHHCNHSWSHDSCCWCGKVFEEDEG